MYQLTVTATDSGELSDSAQLIITISDINDNPPQFTQAVYEGSLNETSTRFRSPLIVEVSN